MDDERVATADDEESDAEKSVVGDIGDDRFLGMIRTNDPAVEKAVVLCNSVQDICLLADALPETSTIEHLRIDFGDYEVRFRCGAAAKLSTSITRMPFLEHFEMLDCDCSGEVIRPIASALANAEALCKMTLSECRIDSLGMQIISDSFSLNRSVRILDLSGNDFGMNGAIALSSLIGKLPNLEQLFLADNGIGTGGAIRLARALVGKESLFDINILHNDIGDEGAAALAGLLSNSNLLQLSLGGNGIGPVGFLALARGISGNNYLQNLDLSYNALGPVEVTDLAFLLSGNTSIKSLDLGGNIIEQDGAEALALAIMNKTIEVLDIRQQNEDGEWEEEDAEGTYDEVFMKKVYDNESLETVVSSNHTFKTLIPAGDALRSLLSLNREGPEKAMRAKLVKFLNEKPNFILSMGTDENLMPRVLGKINRFNAMFELVRNLPDLFSTARKRPYRMCRKRSRPSH